MEKLLNLLNEYEEKRIKKINADWKLRVKLLFKPYTKEALTNKAYQSVHNEIISKYYWFIKRLVEKKKINEQCVPEFYPVSDHCLECINEWIADNTIMLLSIQKNPIDFLISILK